MSVCNICIHKEACEAWAGRAETLYDNAIYAKNYCPCFKNSFDFTEVLHGRWVDHMVRDWRCSECGEKIHKVRNVDGYCYNDKPNYCPNCGAKMDGDGNGSLD